MLKQSFHDVACMPYGILLQGMRIVQSPSEFVEAFLGAQREAAASFGINTILLEKYITKPRHIEVQVWLSGFTSSNIIYFVIRPSPV